MPRLDHAKRQKFLAYYALEELRREKERQEEEEEEEYALLLQRAAVVLLLHDRRVKQERARAKQQRRKRERRLALARYKYHKLVYNNPDRRRVTLRASSLVPVHRSPAMQLLLSGDDDAFIMSMGVDHRLFQFLLDRCTPIYNTTALTVGARAPTRAQVLPSPLFPFLCIVCARVADTVSCVRTSQLANRKLSCDLTLALTLTFLHSVMRQFRLGQMFGLTPGSVSQYLFFGKCMLSTVLKSCRQAQVYWPTPAEQDVYATRVAELYPLLEGVCMSVDGLMLRTLEPVRGVVCFPAAPCTAALVLLTWRRTPCFHGHAGVPQLDIDEQAKLCDAVVHARAPVCAVPTALLCVRRVVLVQVLRMEERLLHQQSVRVRTERQNRFCCPQLLRLAA